MFIKKIKCHKLPALEGFNEIKFNCASSRQKFCQRSSPATLLAFYNIFVFKSKAYVITLF